MLLLLMWLLLLPHHELSAPHHGSSLGFSPGLLERGVSRDQIFADRLGEEFRGIWRKIVHLFGRRKGEDFRESKQESSHRPVLRLVFLPPS